MDLTEEISGLWDNLGEPRLGQCRIVQMVAARRGEGTSTLARGLARFAAVNKGLRVWLVDLDLAQSDQYFHLSGNADGDGPLSKPHLGGPGPASFFGVRPPLKLRNGHIRPDQDYLEAYKVGDHRWWVTRFRAEALQGPQRVHILPRADYWKSLRPHADLVVVDCPAADSSQSGLIIAPFVDQTVLVVSGDQTDVRAPGRLRNALIQAGGSCEGLFFNRAPVQTPKLIRSLFS